MLEKCKDNLRNEPRSFSIAATVGIVVWLLLNWFGMHRACGTYYATPDFPGYSAFVENPYINGYRSWGQAKDVFLFSAPLLGFVVGLLTLLPGEGLLERLLPERALSLSSRTNRAILAVIISTLMTFVGAIRNSEAIGATPLTGWNGRVAPNAVVDNTCEVLEVPWRFLGREVQET
jgi:hypothetical protein